MPIYDHVCETNGCPQKGRVEEHFFHSSSSPTPNCPSCGEQQRRLIGRFTMPFCGAITARYNDPKLEGAHMDGHWVYRRNTPDGKVQPEFIETWQQRKEFMKAEGLTGYEERGPVDVTPEGKHSSSRTGKPGTWV